MARKILDEEIFNLIAKRVVGNRPGKIEPRAVKRRPKPYKLLMIPRNEARQDIMKMAILKKLSNPLIPKDTALIKCHSDLTLMAHSTE